MMLPGTPATGEACMEIDLKDFASTHMHITIEHKVSFPQLHTIEGIIMAATDDITASWSALKEEITRAANALEAIASKVQAHPAAQNDAVLEEIVGDMTTMAAVLRKASDDEAASDAPASDSAPTDEPAPASDSAAAAGPVGGEVPPQDPTSSTQVASDSSEASSSDTSVSADTQSTPAQDGTSAPASVDEQPLELTDVASADVQPAAPASETSTDPTAGNDQPAATDTTGASDAGSGDDLSNVTVDNS